MISSIKLQNFRLYKNTSFDFDKSVNIIVGPNTCGKTSLLEAILIITKGSSYRAKDDDLISFSHNSAKIEADVDGHHRIAKISSAEKTNKIYSIDGKKYKKLNQEQIVPVILFEPNDLLMLNGTPDARRIYLDNILIATVPGYKAILGKFNRAISQRNALLKTIGYKDSDKLFPWNIRLSQLGGHIVEQRTSLVNTLSTTLPDIYKELSSSKLKTDINYLSNIDLENYESKYMHKLEQALEEDLNLGFTRYGPHRDDFLLTFNKHPANIYASRGEIRTATLALKLSENQIVKQRYTKEPIFLLDDVFSELDSKRRLSLAKYLERQQSFITTTDADIATKQFKKHRKILPLRRRSV